MFGRVAKISLAASAESVKPSHASRHPSVAGLYRRKSSHLCLSAKGPDSQLSRCKTLYAQAQAKFKENESQQTLELIEQIKEKGVRSF